MECAKECSMTQSFKNICLQTGQKKYSLNWISESCHRCSVEAFVAFFLLIEQNVRVKRIDPAFKKILQRPKRCIKNKIQKFTFSKCSFILFCWKIYILLFLTLWPFFAVEWLRRPLLVRNRKIHNSFFWSRWAGSHENWNEID